MSNFFTLAVILPLIGAGAALLVSLPSPDSWARRIRPQARYIALATAAVTAILILASGMNNSVSTVLSSWRPAPLFGSVLQLRTDAITHPLTVVLTVVTCSAALVELGHRECTSPLLAAVLLFLLAAGLAALWATNLLTMIVSWALYDLFKAAGHIVAGGSIRGAVRGGFFGGLATLLLWGGALLAERGAGSGQWALMTPSDTQMQLWMLAGLLRLWIYPVHLAAPIDLDTASPLGTPLFLSPIIGWGLWLRLARATGGYVPAPTWVLVPTVGTLALGGFLAWSARSPRRSLSWIGMGANGAILLASLTGGQELAGETALATIAAGSAAWVLGMSVLLLSTDLNLSAGRVQSGSTEDIWLSSVEALAEVLSKGLQRERLLWGIPAVVGILTLVGAPLTLGFVGGANLVGKLVREGRWEWVGACFLGQAFLAAALMRWLLSTAPCGVRPLRDSALPSDEKRSVFRKLMRGVGLGAATLLLIATGFYPKLLIRDLPVPSLGTLFTAPGLTGWLLWAVSLAGGVVLAWQGERLRPKIELGLSALHDLLRLEWLYELVVGTLEQGLSALRGVDEVLGGAGALLWSLVLFLVLVLLWSSR